MVFATTTSFANTQVDEEKSRKLELRVWISAPHQLNDLEHEVVRQVQEHPDDAFFYYLLAHLNLRLFSNSPQDLALVKHASEMAQQAIDLSPKEDYGYIALAETLDLMGQSEKGVDLLETAATADVLPTWRYYFSLARLNAQKASQEKILGLLEQALSFRGSQPEIIVPYIVAVLQTSNSSEELLKQLFTWDAKFPNDLFKQTVAIELSKQGKHKQAHTIYQSIYARGGHFEAAINDAILLYSKLEQPKAAISLFEKLLRDPNNLTANDIEFGLVINSHMGAALLAANRPLEAESYFIKAIKNSPDKLAVIDFASKVYREHKHAQHLSNLIKQLTLEIKPSGVLFAILGETQSEDLAKHNDALQSFSDAILLDPTRSDFYNGMGLTYYRMENHEQALRFFREATRIDPNDATAMYNGACVLSKLGRVTESLGALQEALALDPRLADHARSDKDFNNLTANPEFNRLLGGAAATNDPELEEELPGDLDPAVDVTH
jgi:tetratricopeptide (TPR) repeat protein